MYVCVRVRVRACVRACSVCVGDGGVVQHAVCVCVCVVCAVFFVCHVWRVAACLC